MQRHPVNEFAGVGREDHLIVTAYPLQRIEKYTRCMRMQIDLWLFDRKEIVFASRPE